MEALKALEVAKRAEVERLEEEVRMVAQVCPRFA